MRTDSVSPHAQVRRRARCRTLAVLGGGVLVAYWVATLLAVDEGALNLAFTVVVILVLPVGWWAVLAAPAQLRRFVALAVGALSSQVIGSILWYVEYLHRSSGMLPSLGYWSPLMYLALVMAAAAAWTGVRGILRPRDVMLDCSIVVAAAASVAFAVTEHHLRRAGWSLTAVDAMLRPLLSLLIVVLIVSAVLGRWQALPLAMGLFGASLLVDAGGLLFASYFESRGVYTNDRWPDLLWCTAAVIALFAALTIIARIDRPLRLSREALPGVSPFPLLITITIAWAIAGEMILHGAMTRDEPALIGGVAGVAWIGVAAVLRITAALYETRTAYRCLDDAHFSLEQARERADQLATQRDAIITQLEQRNVELVTIQTMLGPLLDMADERTNGQLRSNLEETGEDLAAWLSLCRSEEP